MPVFDAPDARPAGPNRYKVLKGTHHEADGRVYREGQVVTSAMNLDQMFPNVFLREFPGEDLPPAVATIRPEPPPGERGEKERLSDDPRKPGQVPTPLGEDAETSGVGTKAEAATTGQDAGDGDTAAPAAAPGEEVSEDFPMANLRGLKVFKIGGNSFIVTTEDDLGTPLVSHPMTKNQTVKWVKDYEPKE